MNIPKGLNKLAGFKLLEMHVGKKDSDGNNGRGKVLIPNPSVLTITMVCVNQRNKSSPTGFGKLLADRHAVQGNVTLDLSVEGTPIGKSYLNDLVIRPGDNTLDMTANITQSKVVGFLSKYKNNIIPVDITGNSSVYHGKDLPYFAAALAANKLTVDLNVLDAISG